jgi:biotin carboxyl carrier protein
VRFEVETGGRRRTIDLSRSGADWIVRVDARQLSASLAQAGARWSLLLRQLESEPLASRPIHGGLASSHEIAIEPRPRGVRVVHVDGREVTVAILDPRSRAARDRGPADAAGPPGRRLVRRSAQGEGGSARREGGSVVVSPMPGRVVKVLVAPGDDVAARQGLVVVEAMKMENELRAPRAGRVSEVRVREGAPVDANTVLIVLS